MMMMMVEMGFLRKHPTFGLPSICHVVLIMYPILSQSRIFEGHTERARSKKQKTLFFTGMDGWVDQERRRDHDERMTQPTPCFRQAQTDNVCHRKPASSRPLIRFHDLQL